jgi:hypothetical protein
MWRLLLGENSLTAGTVAASALTAVTALLGQLTPTGAGGGIAAGGIGLLALIVRVRLENERMHHTGRVASERMAHEERMAAIRQADLHEKIAKLEAEKEYGVRLCHSGVCPYGGPGQPARPAPEPRVPIALPAPPRTHPDPEGSDAAP